MMKRIALLFMIVGLGFTSCKKTSGNLESPLDLNLKAGITHPPTDPLDPNDDPGYELSLGGLGDCIQNNYTDGDALRACIANVPVNTSKFVFPSKTKGQKPLGPPLSTNSTNTAHFMTEGTFQDLIADAVGVTISQNLSSPITLSTQDSIDLFLTLYEDADKAIKKLHDPLLGTTIQDQNGKTIFHLALSNAFTYNLFNSGGGVLYPSYGYRYVVSYAKGTLKLPLRWKQYGFDFQGTYTNLL
ncbi:hypothetical protein QE382_002284 [Sphingobacterium zeae]|uniref:Uncharacterized protein n=1 Tax=Sphingobacterium zeae TaxID=1776859 RepID=A0ABU0U5R4_9SPHI|nr:hypothetical protein [Sphingobacterium zeae]MDQ1150300.1 hypothetical protein [Sphingobacterium zeae]